MDRAPRGAPHHKRSISREVKMSGKIILDEVWDLRPGPKARKQRADERARLAEFERPSDPDGEPEADTSTKGEAGGDNES